VGKKKIGKKKETEAVKVMDKIENPSIKNK
jgi:hypothetical protein